MLKFRDQIVRVAILTMAVITIDGNAQDFQRQVITNLVPTAFDFSIADLDNDNDWDAVVSGSSAGIVWFVEKISNGTTVTALHISAGLGPRGVETADIDGDGDVDILAALYGEGRFVLLENLGSGSPTQRFRDSTFLAPANGAWSIDARDADGDGDMDLVLAEYLSGYIRILTQVDTGWVPTIFDVNYPLSAKYADVDSDGDLDVIGTCNYDFVFWVEKAEGGTWTLHRISFGSNALDVVVGDINGNGINDLIVPLYSYDRVAYWLNSGTHFESDTLPWNINRPRSVAVSDFDQDGDLDIMAGSQDGPVAWFRQTNNNFAYRLLAGSNSSYAMETIDYDWDGDDDVVIADYAASELAVYINQMGIPAIIEGSVTAATGGAPIPDVWVSVSETGNFGITGAHGNFRIVVAPGLYTLVARHPCWNTASISNVAIALGDSITRNFTLTRPVLDLSQTSINVFVQNGTPLTIPLALGNEGDGPMRLTAAAYGNSPQDAWLSVEPESLSILPGQNVALTVRIEPDTSNDYNWDYYGRIVLETDACPDSVVNLAVYAYVLDSDEGRAALPGRTALYGAYPNPFNSRTTLRFALAKSSTVNLKIFDVTGREAVRVLSGRLAAGDHVYNLDAGDLASGLYWLVMQTDAETLTRKLMLIR